MKIQSQTRKWSHKRYESERFRLLQIPLLTPFFYDPVKTRFLESEVEELKSFALFLVHCYTTIEPNRVSSGSSYTKTKDMIVSQEIVCTTIV